MKRHVIVSLSFHVHRPVKTIHWGDTTCSTHCFNHPLACLPNYHLQSLYSTSADMALAALDTELLPYVNQNNGSIVSIRVEQAFSSYHQFLVASSRGRPFLMHETLHAIPSSYSAPRANVLVLYKYNNRLVKIEIPSHTETIPSRISLSFHFALRGSIPSKNKSRVLVKLSLNSFGELANLKVVNGFDTQVFLTENHASRPLTSIEYSESAALSSPTRKSAFVNRNHEPRP